MTDPKNELKWPWFIHGIRFLDAPAWICDPEGRLVEINAAGEALLGLSAEKARSCLCSEILRWGQSDPCAFGDYGQAIQRIESGELRTPIRISRGRTPADERWIEIQPLVLRDRENSDAPWLLMIGRDVHGSYLMEQYLERVASRSGQPAPLEWNLTPREREVLDRLARDEDSHAIARSIGVSYATVRNHIQRILRKMEAHSIQEAVARYILSEATPHPTRKGA